MSVTQWIALILLVVGGLNWGLVGLFQFDLVATIFPGTNDIGSEAALARIVYSLVGVSAVYLFAVALMKPKNS